MCEDGQGREDGELGKSRFPRLGKNGLLGVFRRVLAGSRCWSLRGIFLFTVHTQPRAKGDEVVSQSQLRELRRPLSIITLNGAGRFSTSRADWVLCPFPSESFLWATVDLRLQKMWSRPRG